MNLNAVAAELHEISQRREQNGAPLDNTNIGLLKHCAGEVIEATNAYTRWKYSDLYDIDIEREQVEDELADVIACILILCAAEKIDVEKALKKCIAKNLTRAEGKGAKA